MSLIPKKGTVYVVDDDEAVRDSLQWLLEGKDYRVKCFDSAESFLSRFDPREVACLIADIRMDGMSGLELQDRLLERRSPLPVTFITGHGDVPMAVTTMKKGAEDFIEKPFKEDELVALVEKMLERARVDFSKHQEAASRDALLSRLTTREAQVLERIVAGRLNKQIADDLGISIKTVEAHRANIMEKLNANTGRRPAQDRARRAVQGLTASRIDGTGIARQLRAELAGRAAHLASIGHRPGLAVILVGDDPASRVYVRNKVKACEEAGIRSLLESYAADLPRPSCWRASPRSTPTRRCTASWCRCRCRSTSRRPR
jgi:FixJ family two-component response regulator